MFPVHTLILLSLMFSIFCDCCLRHYFDCALSSVSAHHVVFSIYRFRQLCIAVHSSLIHLHLTSVYRYWSDRYYLIVGHLPSPLVSPVRLYPIILLSFPYLTVFPSDRSVLIILVWVVNPTVPTSHIYHIRLSITLSKKHPSSSILYHHVFQWILSVCHWHTL